MNRQKNICFNQEVLFDNIFDIFEIKSMKCTIKNSMNSGLIAGAAATVGALLLGPRGAAIGGVLGGLGASYMMEGTFKSVPDVIMNELTRKQREALYKVLVDLLFSLDIINIGILLMRIQSGDPKLIEDIVEKIKKFLKEQNYDVL